MITKQRLYMPAVAVLAALAGGSYALARGGGAEVPQTKHFHADLSGFEEVPSISSTGSGELDASLTDDTTLHYVFAYADLEGGASLFAHIHIAQRSVNGGVSAFLCGGGNKPACPAGTGTIEGDITPADVIGPAGQGVEAGSFAELVRAMRAGHAYANIHTTRWPGGEIRGQINDEGQKEFDK
jgi:hypothetical protein